MIEFNEKENLAMLELAYESEKYGITVDFDSYIKESINETKRELKREQRAKRGERISIKNIKSNKEPWHKWIMKKFVNT